MPQFNLDSIREAANYLTSDEFRTKLETQVREAARLANDTAQQGLEAARKVSETAITEAQKVQREVAGKVQTFTRQVTDQARETVEKLRSHIDTGAQA